MIKDRGPLTKRLELFATLTEQEKAELNKFDVDAVRYARGDEVIFEGQESDVAYVVQEGWGLNYKLLEGGGRQVIAIVLPGDCVNLRSMVRQKSNFNFLAITAMAATCIPASRLVCLIDEFPHLGVAMLLATAQDDEMVVDHLVSIGRRTAIERLAHLFLELHDRLFLIDLASETEFYCPLTQNHLADTLGLSTIHVNRLLRDLREQKMMHFADHKVELLNVDRMTELTGYVGRKDTPIVVRNAQKQ